MSSQQNTTEPVGHNGGPIPTALASFLRSDQPIGHPVRILEAVRDACVILEDFTPLPMSLDWRIGRRCFAKYGAKAFTRSYDPVPYGINNDGNLSIQAATLVLRSLEVTEAAGDLEDRFALVEIGVGVGLFARFFMDAFRSKCRQAGKDYYERMTLVLADNSQAILTDVETNHVLAGHPGKYVLLCADAREVAGALRTDEHEAVGPVRAVFLNYVLDCLPATVLLHSSGALMELNVQTYLSRDACPEVLAGLSADVLKERLATDDLGLLESLVESYPFFHHHYDYRALRNTTLPLLGEVADYCAARNTAVIYNYGAIECLKSLLGVLHSDGFILINDYSCQELEARVVQVPHQHFAGAIAVGLNLPLLVTLLLSQEKHMLSPPEDGENICSRLIVHTEVPEVASFFRENFGKGYCDLVNGPVVAAHKCREHGRWEAALAHYADALRIQPYNWQLMDEIANLLVFQLQQYPAALNLVRTALSLNPTCSAELWNTLGDCLYYMGNVEEGILAFEKALTIDEDSVRAYYNLAWSFGRKQEFRKALVMIAEGLGRDRQGTYRDRLLGKQGEVLNEALRLHGIRVRNTFDRSQGFIHHGTSDRVEGPSDRESSHGPLGKERPS